MSDIYTNFISTPRKKRRIFDDSDSDESVMTPKKLRTISSLSPTKKSTSNANSILPPHLLRYQSLQTSLHLALSHSLATSAVSPNSDTGIVPNVLNNFLLTSTGLSTSFSLDDLKRLCWLWEWNGERLPDKSDDDNPFLEDASSSPEQPKSWPRGNSGLVITPTTHLMKSSNKRVPAYGIGIEVEIDLNKGLVGGMAAIARWTANGDQRVKELNRKLRRWVSLHSEKGVVPQIPMASLPPLNSPPVKQSALTQRLVSLSPKAQNPNARAAAPRDPPASPSRSSPAKPYATPRKAELREFAIPFPVTPASLPRSKLVGPKLVSKKISPDYNPSTSTVPFPATPQSSRIRDSTSSTPSQIPSTPVHQKGPEAATAPATPSTSRRTALYDRIRKKSESQTPTTPSRSKIISSSIKNSDQFLKLTQEEMRRRCLLGRLSGVAESIWMLFTSPSASSNVVAKKRRSMVSTEVANAIVKSSPVPISIAEAFESITLLGELCPFFVKVIDIGGEDWVELKVSSSSLSDKTESKKSDLEELKSLSPKRIKKEEGGLRQVRERIKQELEAD